MQKDNFDDEDADNGDSKPSNDGDLHKYFSNGETKKAWEDDEEEEELHETTPALDLDDLVMPRPPEPK